MGGGCCVGAAACEQVMFLVRVRGLQRGEAVVAAVLTLVMMPCGGVPVAVGGGLGVLWEGGGWMYMAGSIWIGVCEVTSAYVRSSVCGWLRLVS